MKNLHIMLLLLLPLVVSAQDWEGGVFLGISNYQGDLVEKAVDLGDAGFAYGVFVRRHINEKFSVRGAITGGKIKGDDSDRERRDFRFEANIVEFAVMAEWNFLGRERYNDLGQFVKTTTPYIFLGLGGALADPDVTGLPADSRDLMEDFSSFRFALPFGVGVKHDFSERISLGLEAGFRPTFNDYLDGVSESANPDDNDWYSFIGFNLGIRLGKTGLPLPHDK